MFKRIEKQILDFVDTLPGIKMREVTHGTLYVTLEEDRDCDSIHRKLRNHYRKNINDEGGVNMYSVGGEFAFDFVPEDREAPVFSDADYSGKEEMDPTDIDLTDEQESELDVLMNLEAEAVRGK
jgi:hypothetical protein|tara:strand:- start:247 stop:618 length:372 start_codon:yes stop_codon:yes gene_type:complete